MRQLLDFEKPIAELEAQLEDLHRNAGPDGRQNVAQEAAGIVAKIDRQLGAIYAKLTPWQKTQIARHPERPKALAYIDALFTDYTPLAGDRAFAEDAAIVGGLGRFRGQPVMIIGTERGIDLDTRLRHNFGMARPEGYRKAQRLIELAGRFHLPILTFVDTPGAYPGIDAEARGQAEAIARSIEACLAAPVPIVATIIGEGGSGGAIALAAGDRVLMLEHAIYSVITPEGCASILWRDGASAPQAAEAMRITAEDLKGLKVIDTIIAEPVGGAQRAPEIAIRAAGDAIAAVLPGLRQLDPAALKARRREKFLAMGREG